MHRTGVVAQSSMRHLATWLAGRPIAAKRTGQSEPAATTETPWPPSKRPRPGPAPARGNGEQHMPHSAEARAAAAATQHLPALAAAPSSTVEQQAEVEAKAQESMASLWRLHERTKTEALQGACLLTA